MQRPFHGFVPDPKAQRDFRLEAAVLEQRGSACIGQRCNTWKVGAFFLVQKGQFNGQFHRQQFFERNFAAREQRFRILFNNMDHAGPAGMS